MRRLAPQLVTEEAVLLLEGVSEGKRALEASSKGLGGGQRWWSL